MKQQEVAVTVDNVVLCNENRKFKVVLIKRGKEPFQGQWALPGGFIEEEEDLEAAARRELEEETGVKVKTVEQIRAFGKPHRDPRGRTISIAFVSWISCEEELKPSSDAKEARWFHVEDLPELAFDHKEIIKAAQDLL